MTMPALTWQPRNRRLLVAVMVCAAVIGGAYWKLHTAPRSKTAVVQAFVRDLNAADADALNHDLYAFSPHGSDLGSADPAEIIAHAKRPWLVSTMWISEATTPDSATAWVSGTANGAHLQTALQLFRKHGRWYVTVPSDRANLQQP